MSTANRPNTNRVPDLIIGGLAWACQIAIIVCYGAVIAEPAVWRDMYATDRFSAFCAWATLGSTAFLWAVALAGEQLHFYDRVRFQPMYRRIWFACHLVALAVACAAATYQPKPVALWVLLPGLGFTSIAVWIAWMNWLFLPEEEQAVIDQLTAPAWEQRAELLKAQAKQRHRDRLTTAASRLGYQLPDPAKSAKAEDDAVRWEIPKGKHHPCVYFIANGNRIKIGTTTELRRRIRTLALRAENVALLLPGDRHLEKALHDQFADHRIGTSEWFDYVPVLTDFVRTETDRIRKEQSK